MASSSPSKLLTIPLELRLQIHKDLITDCLGPGSPFYLVGFYRSCRQVHNELRKEYMDELQPALLAKKIWERHFQIHGTLHITLIKRKTQTDNEVQVIIPFRRSHAPEMLESAIQNTAAIIKMLLPLCQWKWPILTLALRDMLRPSITSLHVLLTYHARAEITFNSFLAALTTSSPCSSRASGNGPHRINIQLESYLPRAVSEHAISRSQLYSTMVSLWGTRYRKGHQRRPVYGCLTLDSRLDRTSVGITWDFAWDLAEPEHVYIEHESDWTMYRGQRVLIQ